MNKKKLLELLTSKGSKHYKTNNPVMEPLYYINHHNFNFNLGNVVKYVTRVLTTSNIEDLYKAKHYLEIEIACREEATTEDKYNTNNSMWQTSKER